MEENEIIEDFEDYSDYNEDLESGSGSPSDPETDGLSNEELLDSIRELVGQTEEESTEEELTEEESTEEDLSEVDYTENLTDILTSINSLSESFETYVESTNIPISQKPISEYTVPEALMCIMVSTVIIKLFLNLIDKFTPKIWR